MLQPGLQILRKANQKKGEKGHLPGGFVAFNDAACEEQFGIRPDQVLGAFVDYNDAASEKEFGIGPDQMQLACPLIL